ncbi:MAG: hypothetical protein ACRD0K_17995 [Egibacteraceae bacterium]
MVPVTVPATVEWVNTGVNVRAGQSVTIAATGAWTPGPLETFDPNGSMMEWPDNFLNRADIGACNFCATTATEHWAALIGYIGNAPPPAGSYTSTSVLSEAQKVFFVGRIFQGSALQSGTLWLNFNDDAYSNITSDNSGQVMAAIIVV